MKSSQPFSFYLENNKPYFVTTNQNELCTNYGIRLEVNDQIDCRQAFPVADNILGDVTYANLRQSNILVNGGNEDPNLPAGCHVMVRDIGGATPCTSCNILQFNQVNSPTSGRRHQDAWQVCRSCKYQIIGRVGKMTSICKRTFILYKAEVE